MRITELEKTIEDFHLTIHDLVLEDNKIHGIVGNNGCGKTTLIKLIAGLLAPDKGKIDYGSLTMQDITITTQRPYLLHDSVYNNLIYPLKIRKQKIAKEIIMDWLDLCGLAGKEKQYAPSLSSGERQKLSLARALIFKPKIVCIDETMANLDPDSVLLFEHIISKIQEKEKITWFIISHQLAQIYKISDYVHFMDSGRILISGTPKEVFTNTENPEIKKYLSKYMLGN